MSQTLSSEDRLKFIELLGLTAEATHEQIVAEMTLALEAQDHLSVNKFDGAREVVLLWAKKLILNSIEKPADAYLFWHWFFVYDREHNLSFHDALMSKVNIVND